MKCTEALASASSLLNPLLPLKTLGAFEKLKRSFFLASSVGFTGSSTAFGCAIGILAGGVLTLGGASKSRGPRTVVPGFRAPVFPRGGLSGNLELDLLGWPGLFALFDRGDASILSNVQR